MFRFKAVTDRTHPSSTPVSTLDDRPRNVVSGQITAAVEAFVAGGGKIQQIPIGATGTVDGMDRGKAKMRQYANRARQARTRYLGQKRREKSE